jgi:hypothetical protein
VGGRIGAESPAVDRVECCAPRGRERSPWGKLRFLRAKAPAGGMAERSKASVLKTDEPKGSLGSNPSPSAKVLHCRRGISREARSAEREHPSNPLSFQIDVDSR